MSGRPLEPDELMIEVDTASRLHPTSVRTRPFLEFLSAYLELLGAVAKGQEGVFDPLGVWIEDKCVALRARFAGEESRVSRLVGAANRVLRRAGFTAGSATGFHAMRVRAAAREMSLEVVRSTVRTLGWQQEIALLADERSSRNPELTTLRAVLIRVGGVKPSARFTGDADGAQFSLGVERGVAKQIAAHLYGLLDVEATVTRDEDGGILSGSVRAFRPVAPRSEALRAIDEWYERIGAPWEDVEDLVAELGGADGAD